MLLQGDELGRTQRGNNNAYCQDNAISWVDWDLDDRRTQLLEYARAVMRVRRQHRAFRQRFFFDGRPLHEGGPKDLAWIGPDGTEVTEAAWTDPLARTLGMFIAGELNAVHADGTQVQDDSFLILLHAGEEAIDFTLPGPPYGSAYQRILDTFTGEHAEADVEEPAGSTVTMLARSMIVYRVAR